MRKRFKNAEKQRRYAIYIERGDNMPKNISSADRRLYWFGRYGVKPKTMAAPDTYGYPIICAGYDLFVKNGAPDFEVMSTFCPVREAVKSLIQS